MGCASSHFRQRSANGPSLVGLGQHGPKRNYRDTTLNASWEFMLHG